MRDPQTPCLKWINLWHSAVLNLIEQIFVDCQVGVGAKEVGDYNDVPSRVGTMVPLQTRGSNQDSEENWVKSDVLTGGLPISYSSMLVFYELPHWGSLM